MLLLQHYARYCKRLERTRLLDNEDSALKSKGWTHHTVVLEAVFYITHTHISLTSFYKYLRLSERKIMQNAIVCFYGLLTKTHRKL